MAACAIPTKPAAWKQEQRQRSCATFASLLLSLRLPRVTPELCCGTSKALPASLAASLHGATRRTRRTRQ